MGLAALAFERQRQALVDENAFYRQRVAHLTPILTNIFLTSRRAHGLEIELASSIKWNHLGDPER